MNDQVTFDPFGQQNQPQRPRRSGPPKIFVIAFMFIAAMIVFKVVGGLQTTDSDRNSEIGVSLPPIGGNQDGQMTLPPLDYARDQKPSTSNDAGDWSIEEVPGQPSNNVNTNARNTQSDATSNGDWSIEDVDVSGGNSQRTTRRSTGGSSPTKSSKSTTQNGDWEISVD